MNRPICIPSCNGPILEMGQHKLKGKMGTILCGQKSKLLDAQKVNMGGGYTSIAWGKLP